MKLDDYLLKTYGVVNDNDFIGYDPRAKELYKTFTSFTDYGSTNIWDQTWCSFNKEQELVINGQGLIGSSVDNFGHIWHILDFARPGTAKNEVWIDWEYMMAFLLGENTSKPDGVGTKISAILSDCA